MKTTIRTSLRNNRNKLGSTKRLNYSTIISNKLLHELDKLTHVAIYMSYHNEVQTIKVIKELLKNGVNLYLPKIISDEEMKFYRINNIKDLKENELGILEPINNTEAYIGNLDAIVVPLVGFDKDCNRLGQGKGYYDRYLKMIKTKKIGLAYECQRVEKIEIEVHDIPLDLVITEAKIYHKNAKM
ncbi:MAG: 5-formyltetrahydrofolate cyclo-ligase [Erysipelotrichaceae bacterium]